MTDTLRSGVAPDRGKMTRAQIARTLTPIRKDRIESKQGLSYVPQQEVRAELLRTFGPGRTDHTMHEPRFIYETKIEKGHDQYPAKGNKPVYWVVAYMVGCTLRAYDYDGFLVYECTEYHVEECAPLPNRGEAHAMAVTSAQSYALRRAALSLGDNMGLHLYNKGSFAPLVVNTLALADTESPLHVVRPAAATESAGGTTTPESPTEAHSAANVASAPTIQPPVQSAERTSRLQAATNVRGEQS
jgi:Rad52/22 family double-strand break repair protein